MPPDQTPLPTPSPEAQTQTPSYGDGNPLTGNIHIDDVNRSVYHYLLTKKLPELLIFVPLMVFWEVGAIWLLVWTSIHSTTSSGSTSSSNNGGGYIFVLPVVLFSAWVARIRKQFEMTFLEDFAAANGYTFEADGSVDETYGTIFRAQGRQQVSDIIHGTYEQSQLTFFLYDLTVGSGRYQHRYAATVLEIDIAGSLPDLLMTNKHGALQSLDMQNQLDTTNTVRLEGDFNDHFTLYAPPSNQIEALEVFTPDVMALMEDSSKHFSVEFANNRMYIYCNGYIGTTERMNEVFTLAKCLKDKLGPLSERMQKDSTMVVAPTNAVALTMKRHRSFWVSPAAWIAIGVTFFIFFIITVVIIVAINGNHN